MTHDDLARSLADHLRGPSRMVWCDLQLGPVGSMRPDVYTMDKSFARPSPMAYEVKVSRSDFLADVTAGKWQAYLQVACGVYFACEAGLLTKADVPAHCGLIVCHPTGAWRAAKRATLSPVTIPQDAFLKLLIDGVEREGPVVRRKAWTDASHIADLQKRFGATVARTIRDREAVEWEIESAKHAAQSTIHHAQQEATRLRADAQAHLNPLRSELCAALSLPDTAGRFDIQRRVGEVRAALEKHPATARIEVVANTLRHAIAQIESDAARWPLVEVRPEPEREDGDAP